MEITHREFLKTSTHTVHASTIVFYRDKPVLSWFGGSREGMPDCAVYIQADNRMFSIGEKDQMPRWNPILFVYNDKLFLFVKIGLFCDRWQTLIYDISGIFEDECNIDKIHPQILPAGLNGPVKTKIIPHHGILYCGSSVETMWDWSSYIESYEIRDNLFKIINRSSPLTVPKVSYVNEIYNRKMMSLGIIQPSLWVDKNDTMHAFFRSSRGLGKIYHSQKFSQSDNFWTNPSPTNFDNPNSGVDVVYMNDNLYLVHNPSEQNRYPLVISELDDQFNEKERLVIRENVEEKDVTYSIELSYPYMIEHDKKLHLAYTYGRSKIEYVEVSV